MSIYDHFGHLLLTRDQEVVLAKLEAFLQSPTQVFMLKGYAGSGKTTILKGLVAYLHALGKNFSLMAPTGRAAKVVREKTGQIATTIHKAIYSYEEMIIEEEDSFFYYYKIRNNVDVTRTIFVVDEASMLSDGKSEGEFFRFGSGHLLTDLITYTRVAHKNVNSKIIFVGDPCQLPPVNDNASRAFDADYLKEKFHLSSEAAEMKEVRRQGGNSGILNTASKLRRSITSGFFNDFNLRPNSTDIYNPTFESFLETWQQATGPKIIIAYKNKTCLEINQQIREKRFGASNLPLQESDIVIIGGNNYKKDIFNGEFAVINEVSSTIEQRTIFLRGKSPVILTWRFVELIFPDAERDNKIVKGKVLENFLNGDNTLRPDETQALFVDFCNRHKDLKPKSAQFTEAIISDEYFNCLLIKYGYAVTCHKAQGGEWKNVFTIWDYATKDGFNYFTDKQFNAGRTNASFYRWAYTAVTRAIEKLYTLNPPYFHSYSSMAFLDSEIITSLQELNNISVQSEVIQLDKDLLRQLTQYNLLEQPIPIQDHFIKVRQAVKKYHIEISGWQKLGYEIRFHFTREEHNAVFKTYTNAKNECKNGFLIIPGQSLNHDFNHSVNKYLQQLPNISVNRNTAETIKDKIEFNFELEEKFPFIRYLFDDLHSFFLTTDILIEEVEHQQYKERYTFRRNQEIATIDFEYNSVGFFGRIVPVKNKVNSRQLIADIKSALQTFKVEENAF